MTRPRLLIVALLLLLTSRAPAAEPAGEWISLFDGKTLNGWKINESPETWKVEDGAITCKGPRSHLFYEGPHAPFKDFELEAEVLTRNNSNAGIYFHTKFQETGWPDAGFECQVNNTYVKDPRKTGSLYAIKDVTEQIVPDDKWFKYNIIVQGKKLTVKLNDKVVNEYVEPDDAQKKFSEGTFALQGHDPGSIVSFRNIRVRKLNAPKKEAAVSASDSNGVQVGDDAPKFTVKDDQGKDWNSAEHFQKGVTVVYFYPADFTGGCTKQACSYRDDFGPLKTLGVNVVGVSGDTVETHQKFKQHHGLNFTLLADTEGKAAAAFGAPFTLGEKTASFEGQTFVRTATTQRYTYIVKDGKVAAAYKVSDAAGDSKKIQELVQSLK